MVIPKDCRAALLRRYHDDARAGHVGVYKTYWRLRERYTWPKMHTDVGKHVRKCPVCAAQKPEQRAPAGLMGTRPPVRSPWQVISLDFVGPLPRSSRGSNTILVISDYLTKYVLTFPLRAATARNLVRTLEDQVFLVYGAPQYLICDNGVQMRSREFRNLCAEYGVKISYTPLYHPQADPVERVNRVVKTMLGSYVKDDHRKWEEHLASITCAIRTSRSEVTSYSPYFVSFGRHYVGNGAIFEHGIPDKPPDLPTRVRGFQMLLDRVRKTLASSQERARKTYNLRRRPVQFVVGQKVWRRNKVLSDAVNFVNAKLAPKFVGPFTVRRRMGSWSYELEDDKGRTVGVWHVRDLKPDLSSSGEED